MRRVRRAMARGAFVLALLFAVPIASEAVDVEATLVRVRAKGFQVFPSGIAIYGFSRESPGADFMGSREDPFGGMVSLEGTVAYAFPSTVTGRLISFPRIGLTDTEPVELGLTVSATRTVVSTVPSGDCVSIVAAPCLSEWQGETRVCQEPTADGSQLLQISPRCDSIDLLSVGWGFVPDGVEVPEADAIDEVGLELRAIAGFFGFDLYPIYRIPRVVTSLSESTGEAGETVRLRLQGSIIADATAVDFGPGTSARIVAADLARFPFRIDVEVDISSAASPGPRRVALMTPRGEILSEPDAVFTVEGGCSGDCDGDGRVTIAELIRGVNLALGGTAGGGAGGETCAAFDANGDGRVTIGELIAAVNRALDGCG